MSKPTTIQLTFDTEALAAEWRGWYLDGGGDNGYLDALSCRGVATYPTYCNIHGTDESIDHRLLTAGGGD
jgi:hypothetical protein